MSSNPIDRAESAGIGAGRSLSMVFEIVADERRRTALAAVVGEGAVSRDELLDHVADVAGKDREQLELAFHHNHLPKLVDAGLIEFEADEDVLRSTEAAEQLVDRLGHLFER